MADRVVFLDTSGIYAWINKSDPWEKVVSLYCMRKAEGSEYAKDMGTFLNRGDLPVNYPLYTEPSDPSHVIVTRVLKYECLKRDLRQTMSLLGVPFPKSMQDRCKSHYRQPRISSRAVLTSCQAEFIAKIFAPEIRLFGYRWEDDPFC
jgi:hypothetical protein